MIFEKNKGLAKPFLGIGFARSLFIIVEPDQLGVSPLIRNSAASLLA